MKYIQTYTEFLNDDIKSTNVLYLHGLESSHSLDNIKILARNNINLVSPYLKYENKPLYIEIKNIVKNKNIDAIIGHSFGGFFAYYLSNEFNIPCLIFNPAFMDNDFKLYPHGIPDKILKLNKYPKQIAVIGSNDEEIPMKNQLQSLKNNKTIDINIEKIGHDIPDSIKIKYYNKFLKII